MIQTVLGGAMLLAGAGAPPVATLAELGHALTACWVAPAGSAGSQMTVLVSLTREGGINGKPRITYSKLVGTTAHKADFAAAVLDALARCTPVAVTPGLGGAIAGRPFTLRFVGGGPALPV